MRRKIINDPVHGFISVPGGLPLKVIDSLMFQRLRRIKQLGLTHLVYPGAVHTRFHHSVGAMHLMQEAIDTLRRKGHEINYVEEEGALMAILLHDMGHGPFSHALEGVLVPGVGHEHLSLLYLESMNTVFGGDLEIAIKIFKGEYSKGYLHQLVTSQLDVDRLDYLKRDSFFTGVSEGVIGTERIINMLNVVDGQLVIEQKGIYSVEKFLLARRLMYWQVYLHKTVLAAESMLIRIINRVMTLSLEGMEVFATPSLKRFLTGELSKASDDKQLIEAFTRIDDMDIIASLKEWSEHQDLVLKSLTRMLMSRDLFRCDLQKEPFPEEELIRKKQRIMSLMHLTEEEAGYFVYTEVTSNSAYTPDFGPIMILMKDGKTQPMTEVSDQLDISFHSSMVSKHYCCYPKCIL